MTPEQRKAMEMALEALIRADRISGYPNNKEAITAMRQALEQQPAAPAIPEGWKLVPVEPTKEMLDKGRIDNSIHGRTLAEACYRSMLNAAPEQKGN